MWPAEWVAKRYFSLDGTYSRKVDRLSASKRWAVDKNYASVALHEMRNSLLVDRVGKGEHMLVPPEKWIRVHSFLARAPEISEQLVELLRDSMNEIDSLIFYGSRTWGAPDKLSDWDFLIVVRSNNAKERIISRLSSIEKREMLDVEVLTPHDLERFLIKDPIFLKIISQSGQPIIDSGAMGIVKVAQVTTRHMAVELLAAKESIMSGIKTADEGKFDLACYLLVRGARRTIAAELAMGNDFSDKALEEKFMERFSEFEGLREVCKKVSLKQRAEVSRESVKKLMKKTVIEWEKTLLGLHKIGKEK